MNFPDLDPLEVRIQQLLDDELTAEQFAEIESELLQKPEAMDIYLSYSRLQSGLQSQGSFKAVVEKMPVVPMELILAHQRQRSIRISLLSAAALIAIMATVMWFTTISHTPHTLATVRATPGTDFTITHNTDDSPPVGKVMVENSRIVLHHGVIELDLPHDVRAIIEAPAEMVLRDDRTLELDHGRAYFKISSIDGQGFAVVTPHQRIVDLGTAFGIDCRNGSNEVELHVLEGRVRIDSKKANNGEIIEAPRSVLLAGTQIQRDLDGPPAAFLENLPPKIDILLDENFETGLIVGRDYAIQMDRNVIHDLAGNRSRGIDDDTSWKFTTALPATVPIAVASYTYTGTAGATDQPSDHQPSGQPQGLFLDPGNVKLTDNNPGHPAGWTSGTYVGFKGNNKGSSSQVTFDLGAAREVQAITVNSRVVGSPVESIKISTSTDGLTYSNPTLVTPKWSGLNAVSTAFDLTDWGAARYYQLNFVSPGEWLFLGEVAFGAVPTPSHDDIQGDLENIHPAYSLGQTLSKRDKASPIPIAVYPTGNSKGPAAGGQLKVVFNEPIKFGSGRVFIQNVTDWSENRLAVWDHSMSINDRVLTINPPVDLEDGTPGVGWLARWKTDATVTFLNPSGGGKWYNNHDLQDDRRTRGMIESMRSPGMASIRKPIRREIGTITAESRYTVSTTIGVRANDAKTQSTFLGYTIRLTSGDTVLAKLTSNTPPGPANSVNTVGFSWDAATLPDGVQPGDPLAIEIIPNPSSGHQRGYLDLNALRISVLGQSGR